MRSVLQTNIIFHKLFIMCLFTLFLPPLFLSIMDSTLTFYIGEAFFIFVFLLWLINILKLGKITYTNPIKIHLFFVITSSISVVNADNLGRYLIGLTTYIEAGLVLLVLSNLTISSKKIENLGTYFLVSSFVLTSFIFYETILINGGNFMLGNKIVLDIGSSNYLASLLLIPFFILFSKFLNKLTLQYLAGVVLTGVALIFTGSRTSLFIVFVFSVFLIIKELFLSKISIAKKTIIAFSVCIGAYIIYVIGGRFLSQMAATGRFDNLVNQSNLIDRFRIFEFYFAAFKDHPILGNGYLNVNALNEYYLAHNFILQTLADTGILSCLLFMFLLFTINSYLKKGLAIVKNKKSFVFIIGYRRGFWAVLAHGMLEPNFGTKLFMLYVFLGLGIVTLMIQNESKKSIH
ncbi:hypothetical protein A7K91_21310 [Paenibacillus oryzae]|uniref:O-antigen ligase-related domain-containing protein n=1 Tax=Paenibacillus oryzae TaxID=1844972 RepID=A0A1A5YS25_9BACL|nr:O-antigen ligase family protein [Paenibacillus oryzae]OBR68422.1 hypothetical protein A7K91_21310 [Paenibacillus oryzae]